MSEDKGFEIINVRKNPVNTVIEFDLVIGEHFAMTSCSYYNWGEVVKLNGLSTSAAISKQIRIRVNAELAKDKPVKPKKEWGTDLAPLSEGANTPAKAW